ncbi:MAG: hypothetical protein ACRDHY_03525 [Anaerolineales bacterium]
MFDAVGRLRLNGARAALESFLSLAGLLAIRILPPRVSYLLAEHLMGGIAARPRSGLFRAVQANQAVVRGLALGDPRLDQAVRDVFLEAGRGYVDWFRAIARGPNAIPEMVHLSPVCQEFLRGRGAMVVGGHLNGFNLMTLRLAQASEQALLLTMADVSGTHALENSLRRRLGLVTAPLSVGALRRGLRLLRAGGKVMTGVDRPGPDGHPLLFFGRRALLPVGHVRLAARAAVPIFVADVRREAAGRYFIDGQAIDSPRDGGSSEAALVSVAEEVLRQLEQSIRRRPSSWLMFVPVWQPVEP